MKRQDFGERATFRDTPGAPHLPRDFQSGPSQLALRGGKTVSDVQPVRPG